jgi:hypothetical protein
LAGNSNLFLKTLKNELFAKKIVQITRINVLIYKISKYQLPKKWTCTLIKSIGRFDLVRDPRIRARSIIQ